MSDIEKQVSIGDWFGKGCLFQKCQFEEGQFSLPVATFCAHPELKRTDGFPMGSCNEKNCFFTKKEPVKRIVQIAFAGNHERLYDFFTDIEDLQNSEWVVCHTLQGYSVGRVVKYIETSTKATNWIVQRVDVEGHKAKLELERERLNKEVEDMLG